MSRAMAAIAVLEGVGDRMNAILVKEVRQALKSRQFVGAFMLMLLAAWGGTVLGLAFQGPSLEFGSPAQIFFGGFSFVLCAATLIVVPFAAYRSFVEERSEHTLDLVQITGLTPRRIVAGKLLSALVQSLVFYSAIAPFIAFTSLLQGFNVVAVIYSLVLLLLVSQLYSMIALTIGASARTRSAMSFTSIFVIMMCLGGAFAFWINSMSYGERIDPTARDFWWFVGFLLFAILSTIYLCLQISVSQLTFESDNRSTGIRLAVAAQFLLFWLGIGLAQKFSGMPSLSTDDWEVFVTMSMVYATAAGMFFCAESEFLSRRVRRGIPRSGLLRLMAVPFYPGGTRGLLFSLLAIGFLLGITAIFHPTGRNFLVAVACYAVMSLTAVTAIGRGMRRLSRATTVAHVLVVFALLVAVLMIVPFIPRIFGRYNDYDYLLVDILMPFYVLDRISGSRPGGNEVLPFLILLAGLGILLNFRRIGWAIADIVRSPVNPRLVHEPPRIGAEVSPQAAS